MSGLSHTPGKRAWVYPHRGFESRLLRQVNRLCECLGCFDVKLPQQLPQNYFRVLSSPQGLQVRFDLCCKKLFSI